MVSYGSLSCSHTGKFGDEKFEPVLWKEIPKVCKAIEDTKCNFPECRKKIANRPTDNERKNFQNWFLQSVVIKFKKWDKET